MSNSIHEALLNSNAVIEYDTRGIILWANENFLKIFGYTLEEVVNQHHSLFMPESYEDNTAWQMVWTNLLLGKIQAGEFKRKNKKGEDVWIQGSYTPVVDPEGKVSRVIKMAVDVTERHTLAANLAQKNNELSTVAEKAKAATYAKSVFLANMSHEIRTPLNSIIGITDTLAETPLDHEQASFVEILQKANHQLMMVLNDILDLSKVEAGEVELTTMPFNLKKVIDDLYAVLNFRAKEKGLTFTIDVEKDIPLHYMGDANRLRQILMNLLNNAIKFTFKGHISLQISKNYSDRPGNLYFAVTDSGIGIPKGKYKSIFRPFSQADATTTRKFGGTGLGLAISQKLVTLMKGHIWVESEVNKGSRFCFTATMPETTGKTSAVHSALEKFYRMEDNKPISADSRLRILVVDDVDDNRNLIGIYLQKTPHQVFYAQSGLEALQMVEKENFDIIFMDVQMPEMDGYEATRLIRRLESDQSRAPARIYACTANAFSEDIAKSIKAGCDQHLSKPIRKDTLLGAINASIKMDLI